MARAKTQPIFSKAARQAQTKSPADRLRELEELLKLNRGGFSTLAEDIGSNQPFLLPGRQAPISAGIQASAVEPQEVQLPDYSDLEFEMPPLEFEMPPLEDYDQDQIPQGDQLSGAKLFFDSIREMMESQTPSVADQLEQIYQTQGIDYAIQSRPDGSVLMRSGQISYDYREPEAIAQRVDGGLLYSDGTIRYPGVQPTPGYDTGLDGLLQMLGMSGQSITQEYGNYNPGLEPGSGYNLGTDIRTRDLANRAIQLPIGAQVVEVLRDDGTRWGDQSGHRGYGNSVLLRLPSGEMIRLSHLDVVGDFQPGQYLQAGTYIGMPGATGNVTGEHLDLEYYDQNGQIANPMNFSGFSNPESLMQMTDLTRQMSVEGITQPTPIPPQAPQLPQIPQMSQVANQPPMEGGSRISGEIARVGQNLGLPAIGASELGRRDFAGAARELAGTAGQAIAAIGQATGIPETGIAANLRQGKFPEAISAVGSQLGLPDINIKSSGEQARAQGTNPIRQFAGQTLENIGDRLGIPENNPLTGGRLSELVAGGNTLRTNQAFASGESSPELEQQQKLQSQKDYENSLLGRAESSLPKIKDAIYQGTDVLAQAGSGVGKLFSKRSGALVNLFSRPKSSQIAGNRAVGETGSQQGNVLGLPVSGISAAAASRPNDTTDPFFKSELFKNVQGFVRGKGTPDTGALSLDVFNDQFYQDPDRVKSVFGNTFLEQPATAKFEEYGRGQSQALINQLRQQYGDSSKYDQKDLENIIASIPEILTQTPNISAPKKIAKKIAKKKPSLSDYLARGKTAAQWYAETGQQSSLDSIIKSGGKLDKSGNITFGPNVAFQQSQIAPPETIRKINESGSGTQAKGLPSGYTTSIESGGQWGQTTQPGVSPTKSASAQLSPNTRNKPSLFSSVYSKAKNLFNRFFN